MIPRICFARPESGPNSICRSSQASWLGRLWWQRKAHPTS